MDGGAAVAVIVAMSQQLAGPLVSNGLKSEQRPETITVHNASLSTASSVKLPNIEVRLTRFGLAVSAAPAASAPADMVEAS